MKVHQVIVPLLAFFAVALMVNVMTESWIGWLSFCVTLVAATVAGLIAREATQPRSR